MKQTLVSGRTIRHTSHKKIDRPFPVSKLAVLLLCLCLAGCSTKNPDSLSHLETQPYIMEQQVNSVENITIYTYNEDSRRLESRIVQVTIYPDQTKAEAALGYLLSTPEFEFSLNSYGIPDYTLTVAGGIATVRITNSNGSENHFRNFALHFSIVNTLSSIDGINYVSVYAGNSEMAGDVYIGPSRFLETGISNHYTEYYDSDVQKNISSQNPVVLYYSDKGQTCIVPEQHQVYTNTRDYTQTVNAVLETMAKHPTNAADLMPPVSTGLAANTVEVTQDTMSVDFSASPSPQDISNQVITYGALYHTLTGIYPAVTKINFTVNGAPVTINGMSSSTVTKDTFTDLIGSAVTLYMAQSSLDTLYPVNRYLSASSGISITHIMQALAAGPTVYDSNTLISPIIGGLTMDNLINARVINDVAVLNFDTGFYDSVKDMSKAEETIMVYGIVNTLTSREQINRVQFLINNQSFETINGHIYYSQPLFSNPGLSLHS